MEESFIVNNVSSANSVGVKFDACGRSFTYKANSSVGDLAMNPGGPLELSLG